MRKAKDVRCVQCGTPMEAGRGDWSGFALPGVTLVDVPVLRCPGCGETEHGVEEAEELSRLVAAELVAKPARLTPEEIRFLRSHLELSGGELAKHMGTTPETVSRWENGAMPMGRVADRLLRAMVALRGGLSCPLEVFRDVARGHAKPIELLMRHSPSKGWRREESREVA
jgi:putative zinc finger/helix-turn-helix YgiT family protein